MLGLYVSDHPLFGAQVALRAQVTTSVPALWDERDGASVTVGGIVSAISRRYTRKGEPMLFFQLEDLEGSVEVVCFPRTVADFGPLVRQDTVLVVSGRVDQRGDSVKLVAQGISEPDLATQSVVRLQVAAVRMSRSLVGRLRGVLANHPGNVPVLLHLAGETRDTVVRLGDDYRVEPRTALYAELQELLGAGAVLS
jgi:DNA polymerase-3 subunit alpha